MSKARTPSAGLKILENLHINEPHHQGIRNSLINSYIRLGFHNDAAELIKKYYNRKQDMQSLKFSAWLAHKQDDIDKEHAIWNTILEQSYRAEVHHIIDTLVLRSKHFLKLKPSDIPLLSVVRNEMLRLPFFLEYYRKLGVTQFIFVDNNSDDGSFEYLLKQRDCHVFWTNDSYNQSGHGLTWLNYLLNDTRILHTDQWYIIADADEFLIYPNCETTKLKDFINYLNIEQSEAVPSFMLDMFSKDVKTQLNINSGDNLINSAPFFLNNYEFYHNTDCPYIYPTGGIRDYLAKSRSFTLPKVSLLKKLDRKFYLLSSTHRVYPLKCSSITSTFLHFKFIGNLYEKSIEETQRKEHWAGGADYRKYTNFHKEYSKNSHQFSELPNCVKFQSSQQLVDLGLIKTTNEWDSYAEK